MITVDITTDCPLKTRRKIAQARVFFVDPELGSYHTPSDYRVVFRDKDGTNEETIIKGFLMEDSSVWELLESALFAMTHPS